MNLEEKMKLFRKVWSQDKGSIDLIQLFVGLLIISIASIGTVDALFSGYEQLDYQMRFRKAITIARAHAEYWQGRIHTDFPSTQEMQGNLMNPEVFMLDERDPTTNYDDIYCEVRYSRIEDKPLIAESVDGFAPDQGGSKFFLINVNIRWFEPNDSYEARPREIDFFATMVQAGT